MEITLEEYKAAVTTQFEALDMIAETLEPTDPNRPMMRESASEVLAIARAEYQAEKISIEALTFTIQLWSAYH